MGKTNPYLSRKIYFFCCRQLSTSEEITLCSVSAAERRKLRSLHSFLLFPTRPAALGSRGGPQGKEKQSGKFMRQHPVGGSFEKNTEKKEWPSFSIPLGL